MGLFKKVKKYSKPSTELDKKIKSLDEGLKKTKSNLPEKKFFGEEIDVILNENFELENWRQEYDDQIVDECEQRIQEIRERHNDLLKVQGSIEHLKNKEIKEIFNELYQGEVQNVVEKYISKYSDDIVVLREDLFYEIKKKPVVDLGVLEDRINLLTLKYNKLSEGLLNEPKTGLEDPVTFEQLKNHYQLLVARLQEQLATLGGGGEVRLQYLDDIVGIATNASAYDGKFLKYNHSLRKFEFVTVSGGGGGGGVSDIVEDTTPQLGGDLDLNGNDITGTGSIDITGNLNVSGIVTVGAGTSTIGVESPTFTISNNNLTVSGTAGTTGEIKQIGGAPFYYDGTAWREFALLEGTPVTTPGDTDWDNVMIRLNFEQSGISSVTNLKNDRLAALGSGGDDIQLVTSPAITNFGKSARFAGSHFGLYLLQDPNGDGTTLYDFTGTWTIELWVHVTDLPTNASRSDATDSAAIVSQGNYFSGYSDSWTFGLMYGDEGIPGHEGDNYSFYWYNANNPDNSAGEPGNITQPHILHTVAGSDLQNTWVHVALIKRQADSKIEFYLNGVKSGTPIVDSTIVNLDGSFGSNPGWIYFGYNAIGSGDGRRFVGAIDDVRITTDERYTDNFTPPTSPHPITGTTSTVYTSPDSKEGEVGLGTSPTWTGTTGVGVTQVTSGQYRLTFSSAYSSTTAYTVNANMMDYDPATSIVGVGVSRVSSSTCDFYVRRLSDDSVVDTGSLAVRVYKK